MVNELWKKFELWVGQNIFDGAKRNIGSGAINTGDDNKPRSGDVIHPHFEIECKCYSKIAIFRWWDKLKEDCAKSGKTPLLIMREKGDIKDTLVTVHWELFKEMKESWEREKGLR